MNGIVIISWAVVIRNTMLLRKSIGEMYVAIQRGIIVV